MAKFNESVRGSDRTTNHEGAVAYKMTPELELYSTAVTTMIAPKFYEDEGDVLKRIRSLVAKVSPEFVAKLAVYARTKMYLRSLPAVLAVELARVHNGDNLVRRMLNGIVGRVDDITEVLGYYASRNSDKKDVKKLGKLSTQLRKGLGDAFNKFDEYQFGKYDRKGGITLRDALMLTHPKAKDDATQKLFDKIVAQELEVPYTWEVELSKGGDKKETWEQLIDSGRVGYMALLRNLRNILEAKVSAAHVKKVAAMLRDPEQVRRSKQLPFRFLSAYRALGNEVTSRWGGRDSEVVDHPQVGLVLDAIEEAIKVSVENLKGYDDDMDIMIACDVSGSMQSPVSPKSSVQMYDIGLLLGMLLQHKCKSVITGMFGETYKTYALPKTNILENVNKLHQKEGEVGYATNGHKVVQHLIKNNIVVDRVMIFTDCQMWNTEEYAFGLTRNRGASSLARAWGEYKQIAPNAKLVLFDLNGYGNAPISLRKGDVALVSGWSDKVFDALEAYEQGGSALDEIEKIVL